MWSPGGSWNLGGFECALDENIVRLTGTDSERSLRQVVRQIRLADARSCVPKLLRRQGAPCNPFLSVYVVGSVALHCYDSSKTEDEPMAWTTPVLVEICIGLEINGYLPAEF